MVTHSSILAWEIPWIEEPGRLQSMGSETVRHNLATQTTTQSKSYCISDNFLMFIIFLYYIRESGVWFFFCMKDTDVLWVKE